MPGNTRAILYREHRAFQPDPQVSLYSRTIDDWSSMAASRLKCRSIQRIVGRESLPSYLSDCCSEEDILALIPDPSPLLNPYMAREMLTQHVHAHNEVTCAKDLPPGLCPIVWNKKILEAHLRRGGSPLSPNGCSPWKTGISLPSNGRSLVADSPRGTEFIRDRFAHYFNFRELFGRIGDYFSEAEVSSFRDDLVNARRTTGNQTEKKYLNKQLNALECVAGCLEVASYPSFLWIVPTTRCNLRCYMCRYGVAGKGEDIDFELLKGRMDSYLPYVERIGINSGGELFIHKQIAGFLRYLKTFGPYIQVTSNGMALDGEKTRLVCETVDHLTLSVDGTDRTTYEGIRKGADWSIFLRNLRRILSIDRKERPLVEFNFVAMRRNIRQLPRLISWAGELGVEIVTVIHLVTKEGRLDHEESLNLDKHLSNIVFGEAEKTAEAHGIKLNLPPRFQLDRSDSGEAPGRKEPEAEALDPEINMCFYPWSAAYLDSSGTVMPCCLLPVCMGRLREQDFLTLYNGPAYRKLRSDVNTSFPSYPNCRNCSLTPNYRPDRRRV